MIQHDISGRAYLGQSVYNSQAAYYKGLSGSSYKIN
jgi:hypothetical protein